MDLRLQKPAFWARLHLRSGLQGWDLPRELALDATCDQLPPAAEAASPAFPALKEQLGQAPRCPAEAACPSSSETCETAVQPHLWMWVNPNLVCPIPGHASGLLLPPGPSPLLAVEAPSHSLTCFGEDPLPLLKTSKAEKPWQVPEEASQPKPVRLQKGSCRPTQTSRGAKGLGPCSRKTRRAQGGWPRPPLNYCILISLALSSSLSSSLTVQEIYKFTRHHFPFFRTAPEGWKNTVRHNLCFSSSFEKTADFVRLEGNRKSRLWKLTAEGRRKFQEEAQALPEDMMGLVYQSMDQPELMRPLFGLSHPYSLA